MPQLSVTFLTKAKWTARWTLLALGIASAAGLAIAAASWSRQRAELIVENPHESIRFDREDIRRMGKHPTVSFRLRNVSKRIIQFDRPSTTCGCTVVKNAKQELRPGESTVLIASVSPPVIGTQNVEITLPTSSEKTPIVRLALSITVDAPIPTLEQLPSVVRCPSIRSQGESFPFEITTIESSSEAPWVVRAQCDSDLFTIALSEMQELACSIAGTVRRVYQFEIRANSLSNASAVRAVIRFESRDGEWIVDPAHDAVSIYATYDPPVVVRPQLLFAEYNTDNDWPQWTVLVLCARVPAPIVSPRCDANWIRISSPAEIDGGWQVQVEVCDTPPENVQSSTLWIDVQDGSPPVEVPISLAVRKK